MLQVSNQELLYIIVIFAIIVVMIHQSLLFRSERNRLAKENQDLLNRLMSRDFTAYAAGQIAMTPPANYKKLQDYLDSEKQQGEEEALDDGLGLKVG